MATLIDSYSETNTDSNEAIYAGVSALGQTFTATALALDSSKFYVSRILSPTGNVFSKLYALTGTHGTNAIPTGSALATSDPIDITTIGGSSSLITFTFSGANRYVLTNGTAYGITVEFTGGDGSNFLQVRDDASSPTHAGNLIVFVTGTGWIATNAKDTAFYVYGVPAAVDVTVNLTGVGGSPAVGTLTFNGSVPLVGVAATPVIGTGTVQFTGDVSVSLVGVAAAPVIGTGTVAIEGEVIAPPVSPGGGTGARTGMRIRPTEDKAVYLKGVEANPKIGQVLVLHEMQRIYEKYTTPIPKEQKPAEMPPGMRRLFKPVEKPVPPAVFVYPTPFPKLRSAVGTVAVQAFYEDIDEETIAMIDLL